MKKMILFAAIAAAALVSCQKVETPAGEQASEGIHMSLTADIMGATKVAYTPDGNVLKTTWNASETISVITLDGGGKLVAVDNFTSTGAAGRTKAEFSGTFTGGADPKRVIAVYPALYEDGTGKYDMDTYTDYNGLACSYLRDAEIGSMYIQSTNSDLKQTVNDDASHLVNYCVMAGVVSIADIKTKALATTLSNQMTVLKVIATLPAAAKGKTLSSIVIKPYDSEGNYMEYNMGRSASWEYVDIAGNPICAAGAGFQHNTTLYADFEVPDSGQVVLYIANPFWADRSAGDKWGFQVYYLVDEVETPTEEVFKTFTKDTEFERGNVYRMSVAF